MQTTTRPRVAVVGGGLAGLTAAREVAAGGRAVTVFDKGRGPGGRLSTRRAEALTFDHGAQYFRARDPGFRAEVERWRTAGLVARWNGRIVALDAPRHVAGRHLVHDLGALAAGVERFVGVPGMGALGGQLAAELVSQATQGAGSAEVHTGVRVASAERDGGAWRLTDETGAELGQFEAVLVTTPPIQAAPLVAASTTLPRVARSVAMDPCWAVMLAFTAPLEVPFDGAFVNGGPLSWVARDSSKPGRPAGERWVLHTGPVWSRAHVEDSPEAVVDAVCGAFEGALGCRLPPRSHAAAHRWRYAAAAPPREDVAFYDPALGLGLAGDWLAGSKAQGAWLSGRELAARFCAACD